MNGAISREEESDETANRQDDENAYFPCFCLCHDQMYLYRSSNANDNDLIAYICKIPQETVRPDTEESHLKRKTRKNPVQNGFFLVLKI